MAENRGAIVVLNGAPRSGKSSIVAALQAGSADPWINLGVDVWMQATPPRFQPGIGLRPGGERPDLEPFVVASFAGLYEAIAAQADLGFNVVVDVGHHDAYSRPLGILPTCAARLRGFSALFVGVRCPVETIMDRRTASAGYVARSADGSVPAAVLRWQVEVHQDHRYDIEVDTATLTPEQCGTAIQERLASGMPAQAFADLAALVELKT